MENLLKCNGRRFRAKINGHECVGRVKVEEDLVYLCQNVKDGADCENKLGYKYSWGVDTGSECGLRGNAVTDFQLFDMTAAEIEAYKDWQVGDKVTYQGVVLGVIFRSGEVVICKLNNGRAVGPYTCSELYKAGFRLVADPAPEEDDTVELTLDEIAEKVGVPVEKLRIKEEEGK